MLIALIVALLLVFAWFGFRLWRTAVRLDRLHIRTNAAWLACIEAFARRIVCTRVLAGSGRLPAQLAQELYAAAERADRADRVSRPAAELQLQYLLAGVDSAQAGDLAAELADAKERVELAQQFYNDAVRDTRALRASRLARWFRLAGHAPLPEYFDGSPAA